jgi:hypothetical protein
MEGRKLWGFTLPAKAEKLALTGLHVAHAYPV